MENKKMMVAKQARVLLNDDTQKWMDKVEVKYIKSQRNSLRQTWQSPPRFRI